MNQRDFRLLTSNVATRFPHRHAFSSSGSEEIFEKYLPFPSSTSPASDFGKRAEPLPSRAKGDTFYCYYHEMCTAVAQSPSRELQDKRGAVVAVKNQDSDNGSQIFTAGH